MIRSPKSIRVATDLIGNPAFLLLNLAMDMTWRVFAPNFIGVLAGLYLDKIFDTGIYLTITSIIVTMVLSTLLVVSHIKDVKK